MKAKISSISFHLPAKIENLDAMACENPGWNIPRIFDKTGIRNRYIAALGETASDLAFEAGSQLLHEFPDIERFAVIFPALNLPLQLIDCSK